MLKIFQYNWQKRRNETFPVLGWNQGCHYGYCRQKDNEEMSWKMYRKTFDNSEMDKYLKRKKNYLSSFNRKWIIWILLNIWFKLIFKRFSRLGDFMRKFCQELTNKNNFGAQKTTIIVFWKIWIYAPFEMVLVN